MIKTKINVKNGAQKLGSYSHGYGAHVGDGI